MIRFSNGDPGGVPSSLRSDSLAGVDTLSSVIAPRLLARVVTGGSLSQFPAAWHKAREEVINSSHWWLGVGKFLKKTSLQSQKLMIFQIFFLLLKTCFLLSLSSFFLMKTLISKRKKQKTWQINQIWVKF